MHPSRKIAGRFAIAFLLAALLPLPFAAANHECDQDIELNCVEENPWDGAICYLYVGNFDPLFPMVPGCYGIDSTQRCHASFWVHCTYQADSVSTRYCVFYWESNFFERCVL